MILDHLTSQAVGTGRSASANCLSRRRFLRAGAAAGGGLMLSLSLPSANGDAEAADTDGFAPNAFIRIERDGHIVLTMPYVEMGQGTYTSIPMLIAEELEVDLKQVQLEHAPPNEKLYGNPLLGGLQATGNSNAIRAAWQPLRQAGAIARIMLVSAAAKRWNVDPASCRAQRGEVLHGPTGRSIKYGKLAAAAARMPIPESVVLKRLAMANAVTKIEATYQVPFLAHATMEPMNYTVHVRKDGCEAGRISRARSSSASRRRSMARSPSKTDVLSKPTSIPTKSCA